MTIQTLAASGSDLSRPHGLVNVFHAFSRAERDELARDLEASGFTLEDRGVLLFDDEARYWKVEGRIDVVPILTAVNAMTDQCVEIAVHHKAEYDGWYTEVIPTVP